MSRALNWLVVTCVEWTLRVCRLPLLNSAHVYAVLGAPALQRVLERIGRRRALSVAIAARRRCPAYSEFLERRGVGRLARLIDFDRLPETTKENYVRAFSIEARCVEGRIPSRGVVIDESSGSSGTPNNWVRGRAERASARRLLQHGFALTFPGDRAFFLNCFALGPWATGMNVSMSMVDAVILKSIGPDKVKLANTLRTFGPAYTYVVAGYPPFVKDFIDTTDVELAPFAMHLIVGGEGISEALRERFLRVFRSVHSSYGASDLEINIAAETARSIGVRRLAAQDRELCTALFGRDEPPMVFQYNPLDHYIEQSPEGELIVTLLRAGNVSPKVRYNIHDVGGVLTWREVCVRMRRAGHDPRAVDDGPAFPLLFVYGRSDLTVAFYGAKVYTTDFDSVLNTDDMLRTSFRSFQARAGHDAALNEAMTIALERRTSGGPGVEAADVARRLYDGLVRVNQDFREVAKMFGPDRIIVEMHEPGAGPFAARDIRVKERYVAP